MGEAGGHVAVRAASYIGAYWGSRPEAAADCAARMAQMFDALARVHPSLGRWHRRGRSSAAAREPIATDADSLTTLLALGRNRRDDNAGVIDELGFSFGLWNRSHPAVSLTGTVGAYPAAAGVLNGVVLDIAAGPDSDPLYAPATALAILDAIVAAWDPDWATWTTHSLRESQQPEPRQPVIGWLTYLSPARPVGTGDPIHQQRFHNGTLITASDTLDSTSPATITTIIRALDASGARCPTG